MKRSKQLNTSSLVGVAALSATVLAASLVACSSDSERDGFESTTTSPTDPKRPDAGESTSSASGDAAPDSADPAAPDDCKRAAPSNACGVSPQCGCSAGRTCDVVDSNGNARCVKAGEAPMGHPCTSSGGCGVGLTCVFGTCHAFCNNPGDACGQPGTGACTQVKTTDGADVPNLAVCRVACEPHDPATCGGAVCIIDAEGNTECQSGGSRKEGETCSPEEECGPGLGCVTAGDESTCRRWCRLDADDCGPNMECTGFSPEVLVRGVAYGSCS